MHSRYIKLRRPAVLSVIDDGGPFVPTGRDVLNAVDRRWEQLARENAAYFDGRVYHVLGVHRNGHGGATVHVMECAYRFHAVQRNGFDAGARILGTKAITTDGEGNVLMGRRASNVAWYPDMWEFAPGGVVDFGAQPAEVIIKELAEETGLTAAREPIPLAILFDDVAATWEMIYQIKAAPGKLIARPEYTEIAWFDRVQLPEPLSPIAATMATRVLQ
ncbi:MAG: NUDIX hydrolase [Phycisphaerales bacterium]